ncbi:MAG: hypothetical protein A2Y00_01255 [Omnitrophica WOR_2 bacterium GWF2_43_52]|nr:MAG: hypothetical protein A2062_06030 [Omnitrophica WOR_2 bacterium GWA2_44_7]OGX14624.1 MAG: hypothetical protein A2Y01_02920 [Omnitrophica WOR_2 bacterium GWC2_44_8]OGX22035.1 MAG: hypothetical protein A2Y00_01255 [Omnitrophica WOR_2 bacterium GWF2_43_52]OGX56708.1 MAG: hypothetical protein A2460_06910 [Omnitrophica WOR_2 bacterium RIFOXYC2_FULL_43_9]HAH20004.1 hypothetical protein [Candidatus Omnitrophota bacterium]
MRMTINIEKDKLAHLLNITHLKNKSEAVRITIDEYLRKEKLKKIDSLRGKLFFDKKVLEGRHDER